MSDDMVGRTGSEHALICGVLEGSWLAAEMQAEVSRALERRGQDWREWPTRGWSEECPFQAPRTHSCIGSVHSQALGKGSMLFELCAGQ